MLMQPPGRRGRLRQLAAAVLACIVIALSATTYAAAVVQNYRTPSESFARLVTVDPLPEAEVSPDGKWILLVQFETAPSVEHFAEWRLELASSSIDVRTGNLSADYNLAHQLTLVNAASGQQWELLRSRQTVSSPAWSPDGRRFVYARVAQNGLELWTGDTQTRQVRLLSSAMASTRDSRVPCAWLHDSQRVLCHLVPAGRGGPPPAASEVIQPMAQDSENSEQEGAMRSRYLRNSAEAALYEYYLSSQLALLNVETGDVQYIGNPGIHEYAAPSPDGNHVLDVRIAEPYSYVDRTTHFPREFTVIDVRAGIVRTLHRRELGRWGIQATWAPKGMRHVTWSPVLPATLVYVEALDEGDPRKSAAHRDRLMVWKAPFSNSPAEVVRTQGRMISVPEPRRFVEYNEFPNLAWLPDGSVWLEEIDGDRKLKRVWRVDLRRRKSKVLHEFSYEDRYQDPGTPLLIGGTEHINPVVRQDGDWVYLSGSGSTAEGDRPFLDRLSLSTGRRQRLFRSDRGHYEQVVASLDRARILTRHETALAPANYVVRNVLTQEPIALTHLTNPVGELRDIEPRLLVYRREDGLPLSGILYLPAVREHGQRLPLIIVAYPRSYANAETAGRVRVAEGRYIWDIDDPLRVAICYLVSAGYAVLWDASMPVVGNNAANDTAIAQFIANSKAAVDALVQEGVADPARVAIAGHSYGATMVASLLAHSRLFATGMAFSGVYNLTMTPHGFARETRSLWQAPEVYRQLSPLFHAEKIEAPLLLVHGDIDPNANTPLTQSQMMFRALRAFGRDTRLVVLPYEGHIPHARQSIQHVAWEMREWLNKQMPAVPIVSRRSQSVQ